MRLRAWSGNVGEPWRRALGWGHRHFSAVAFVNVACTIRCFCSRVDAALPVVFALFLRVCALRGPQAMKDEAMVSHLPDLYTSAVLIRTRAGVG